MRLRAVLILPQLHPAEQDPYDGYESRNLQASINGSLDGKRQPHRRPCNHDPGPRDPQGPGPCAAATDCRLRQQPSSSCQIKASAAALSHLLDPMDPQSSSRVTLQSPGDWNRWISVIRKQAKAADVWDIIDPSKEDKDPLQPPPKPTAQDADPSVTLVKDLGPEKIKILDALLQQQSTEFKLYRDKVKALQAIQRLISKTVVNYESTIEGEDEDDIAKQLLLLKNKTHSADWNKEDTILTQFQGILKSPERTNLSQWVIRWQKVLTEA
ncbi:hypothetical protein AUP68_10613 [Ilyonectria robusta]